MKQSATIETAMIAAVIAENKLEAIGEASPNCVLMDSYASCAAIANAFYQTFKDVEDWDIYLASEQTPYKATDWEEFICWYVDKSLHVLWAPFAISVTCYKVAEAAQLLKIDYFRADAKIFICDQTGLWIECCENSHCWTSIGDKEFSGEFAECIAFLQKTYSASKVSNVSLR